jgi:transcriptional regulator with XRE-family HTH domain
MEFTVEFYETVTGRCPVREFFDELKASNPENFAALRKDAGLSQKDLAGRVGTSQQQISRLESPGYEGHSLSMIRRVAEVLGASVRVQIQQHKHLMKHAVAENEVAYKHKR